MYIVHLMCTLALVVVNISYTPLMLHPLLSHMHIMKLYKCICRHIAVQLAVIMVAMCSM